MPKAIDVTGQKFGNLLAIKKVQSKIFPSGQSRVIWRFKCDCGKTVDKTLFDIKRGDTKSCGCLKKKRAIDGINTLPNGESSFRALFDVYKKRAMFKNLNFELSKDDFLKLTSSNCYYCGEPPLQKHLANKVSNGYYLYNGIDRVNSKKGYVNNNVVSCCKNCNFAKRDLTYEDFIKWLKKAYEHLNLIT